jgi:two-component system, cell cycle response regulator DivK
LVRAPDTFEAAPWGVFATQKNLVTKVLVVDDNADDQEIYSTILYYNNFDVVLAADAVHAVKEARASQPDIILMDVNLGDISGLTAAYHIRQDPATCSIPIVCFTAFDLRSEIWRAAGCEAMLQKPVSAPVLVSVIRGLVPDARVAHPSPHKQNGPEARARKMNSSPMGKGRSND